MRPNRAFIPVLALGLAALVSCSAAFAKDGSDKASAPAKSIRVAVLPLMNRTQEALASQIVNAVLKEQFREFDADRATFLLPADVERVLGTHNQFHLAMTIAETWAQKGELDTAALAAVDSLLEVDALLCVAISDWEVRRITVINAGRSSTTIGLRFALFDAHSGAVLWNKSPREERLADEYDISSGSVTFDEAGSIRSRTTNEPPRPKEVTESLFRSAFKKFPRS